MKALRPLWIALRAAVLATAVFWVAMFIIDHSGWNGLMLWGIDFKEYAVFLVIFFLGVLTVKT